MPKQLIPLPQLVKVQTVPTEVDGSLLHLHHCTTPHVSFPKHLQRAEIHLQVQEVFLIRKVVAFSSSVQQSAVLMALKSWAWSFKLFHHPSINLFFSSEVFEVCKCIIYDASLCLVTMNDNGLLEAEAYPLRRT